MTCYPGPSDLIPGECETCKHGVPEDMRCPKCDLSKKTDLDQVIVGLQILRKHVNPNNDPSVRTYDDIIFVEDLESSVTEEEAKQLKENDWALGSRGCWYWE